MPHYHIRWSNSKLDWEAFPTSEEAKAQAEQMAGLGESYVIERLDGDCPQCSRLSKLVGRAVAPTQTSVSSDMPQGETWRDLVDSDPCLKQKQQSSDYEKIVDDAVAIMRADYASLQMLFPERGPGGELRLLAFHGFNPQAAAFWEWVRADSKSTCGIALRDHKRVVVADIATCDFMAGSADQRTYLQTGIRACQTTPLIGRGGMVVGMISTHWRTPHQPSEKDFQLFDNLARRAADLLQSSAATRSTAIERSLHC